MRSKLVLPTCLCEQTLGVTMFQVMKLVTFILIQ